MDPKLILIDGYNVIRNTPGLAAAERKSLSTGREALLAQVSGRFRHTPHRVVVVFDGDGPDERRQGLGRMGRGQVVFTRRGVTADTVIGRLAAEARSNDEPVMVCTNDLAVRMDTAAFGDTSAGATEFGSALNTAPKFLEKRFRHQQAIRRLSETSDDEVAQPRKGNPRRAPKRRRGLSEPTF